ncbi:MAG: hypothetical protein GVY21_00815 [Gammaproteobacteria bacterium]|nr:hypothetical protein [Gammaproteobacteria bacterium]
MQREEQEALLDLWTDFLDGRAPDGALMRDFYFEVVSYTAHYRYGMAPELFDLLVNGVFDLDDTVLWASARRATDDDHRAA